MTALVTEVSQLPRDGIVYFFAEWSPATKAMDVLVAELEVQHPSIHIVKCEAESAPELSSKLFVEVRLQRDSGADALFMKICISFLCHLGLY